VVSVKPNTATIDDSRASMKSAIITQFSLVVVVFFVIVFICVFFCFLFLMTIVYGCLFFSVGALLFIVVVVVICSSCL